MTLHEDKLDWQIRGAYDGKTPNTYYEEGYKDAAVNMRMFYAMKKEFPSTAWVRQSAGKDLGTREKILEHGFE